MKRLCALAAVLLLAAAPAIAQTRPSADCGDDSGVDRCDPAVQAKVRAAFGVASAEAIAGEGTQMLRSFFVNGYGGDEPLITFLRRRGAEPEVIITAKRGGKIRPEMRAAVPLATWERLTTQAAFFDRELVKPKQDGDDIVICLHSWVVTMEATGLTREEKGVRRKTEDSCSKGMAVPLAFDLAEAAMELLPACKLLLPDQHRNVVTRLDACSQLEGDRVAAAQAMNRFRATQFDSPYAAETATQLAYYLYDRAELIWPDAAPVIGDDEFAAAWTARRERKHYFYASRFIGEAPDRVRVEGLVGEVHDDEKRERREAKAVQIWTRENG